MSVSGTIAMMTKILAGIDKLIRIFWIFVFWRRKVRVYDAMKALHRAGKDPDIRKALESVKHGRYVIEAIDSNSARLKDFAVAYGALDSTLKQMLHKAKKCAAECKQVAERKTPPYAF